MHAIYRQVFTRRKGFPQLGEPLCAATSVAPSGCASTRSANRPPGTSTSPALGRGESTSAGGGLRTRHPQPSLRPPFRPRCPCPCRVVLRGCLPPPGGGKHRTHLHRVLIGQVLRLSTLRDAVEVRPVSAAAIVLALVQPFSLMPGVQPLAYRFLAADAEDV